MTAFSRSPKLLNGGIVLIDYATAQVQRIISLQYNPESLSRTIQVQSASEAGNAPRRCGRWTKNITGSLILISARERHGHSESERRLIICRTLDCCNRKRSSLNIGPTIPILPERPSFGPQPGGGGESGICRGERR